MKVSITIAEKRDGTFAVLYCGGDAQAALDACLKHNEPDTKEVCMFRKPFHYKRRVPAVVAVVPAAVAVPPPTKTKVPPPAENEPPVPEAEASGEAFLGEPPAQPGRRGRRRS